MRSSQLTLRTTCGSPASAAFSTRSIWDARRDLGAREPAPDRLVRRCRSISADGLVFKSITGMTVDPGGRWYIIGELTPREVREADRAQEEEPNQVGASSGPAAGETPSALQLRI